MGPSEMTVLLARRTVELLRSVNETAGGLHFVLVRGEVFGDPNPWISFSRRDFMAAVMPPRRAVCQ